MPRPESLGVPCDICGKDEYWNNTQSKKNAKAPDWVCANKECAGKDGFKFGRWERDRAKWGKGKTKEPQGGRLTPDDTTPDERGEKVFSWEALAHTYAVLTKKVVRAMWDAGLGTKVEVGQDVWRVELDQSAVQAGVATLLIQGEKAHIPLLHPRKVEKVAPKQVAKESYAEMPEGLEEDDFDRELPF